MSLNVLRDESAVDRVPSAVADPLPAGPQRALTFGLLVSALRCILQYVLLPFVLPWIGLAASIPRWFTLVLCAVALGSLTRNLRILWKVQHPRRRSYLALAGIVAAVLLVFIAVDVHTLFG